MGRRARLILVFAFAALVMLVVGGTLLVLLALAFAGLVVLSHVPLRPPPPPEDLSTWSVPALAQAPVP